MKIEKYERWFMMAVAGFLALAVVALIMTIAGQHAQFPESSQRIDPKLVSQTAPFDDPGVHQRSDGDYDVVIIAQAWQFTPKEIELPVGATAHFHLTSIDVVHGFRVPGTNANSMIIPGQISEFEVTFDKAGQHSMICHEYCGIQHHTMGGRIVVTGGDQ